MSSRCHRVALAILLSLASAFVAFPQANTGTVVGTVTDSSGAAVPNCKIVAQNQGTGVTKETTTDPSGNYRISYLLPGTYEVSAEAPNFKRAVQSGLTLDVDQRALASFTLQIGAVSEKVEVAATAPLLQTQSVEQSQTITEKQMRELPIDVRDFGQFASLQAGTVIGTGGLGQQFRRRQSAGDRRRHKCEWPRPGRKQLATGRGQRQRGVLQHYFGESLARCAAGSEGDDE